MTDDASALLNELRALPAENEWLDFKEAKQTFDLETLGRYVSALANEANLTDQPCGWLVLGVGDKRDTASGLRPVVGSRFKLGAQAINELKQFVAEGTAPSMTFSKVVELPHPDAPTGSRVLLLAIPPAPRGSAVAWRGHYYGRAGESLGALGAKFEVIRMQAAALDWTAQCVSRDWAQLSAVA